MIDAGIFRRFLRSQRAAVSVEFALVSVVAIPLFFGIFEAGRLAYNKVTLDYLADEIARAAALRSGDDPIDGAFFSAAMADALAGVAIFIDADDLEGELDQRSGHGAIVLSYPHRFRVPLVADRPLMLTAVRILP